MSQFARARTRLPCFSVTLLSPLLAIAVSLLSVCTISASPARALSLFDETFDEADWVHTKIIDSTSGAAGTFTAMQESTGGNPGPYQSGTHTWNNGYIAIAHIFSGAGVYDPGTQGALALLDWSVDLGVPVSTNTEFTDVAATLVVMQGGNFYLPDPFSALPFASHGGGFTQLEQSLVEGDLVLALGSGVDLNSHPDFSSSGAPLSFGFATVNSATGSRTTHWVADNYQLVPEPSTGLLLAIGFLALAKINSDSRRRAARTSH